eukprot:TRINITY_DN6048_c0_g1_i1.p1 TRINITY_DN6048_c0_g1~~TRINITY_DN6048_c0_g1_i1.p1  ORF type:complete len:431 (+),score=131.69 TRINITY_DN6048_c0_g1_i1:159-1295(+)
MTDILKNVLMSNPVEDDGYDHSDSFLDDDDDLESEQGSDSEDMELPPTKYKDFYINFGEIEFLDDEEGEEEEEEDPEKCSAVEEIEAAFERLRNATKENGLPKKRFPKELDPFLLDVAFQAIKNHPRGHITSEFVERITQILPYSGATIKTRMRKLTEEKTLEDHIAQQKEKKEALMKEIQAKVKLQEKTIKSVAKTMNAKEIPRWDWSEDLKKKLYDVYVLTKENVEARNKLSKLREQKEEISFKTESGNLYKELSDFWPTDWMPKAKIGDVIRSVRSKIEKEEDRKLEREVERKEEEKRKQEHKLQKQKEQKEQDKERREQERKRKEEEKRAKIEEKARLAELAKKHTRSCESHKREKKEVIGHRKQHCKKKEADW